MKIALIGTRGVPAHYGGFETAVEEVGARLVEAGHDVVVFCRGEGPAAYRGMRLVHLPALPKRSLETLSHTALSVIHPALAGTDAAILFNAANSPFLPILRARRIPVATHVDGLEWRRSKWGPAGRRYYRVAESLAVRWSDALIADAAGIADYYRQEFGAATRLITYGAPRVAPGADRLAELDLSAGGYHLVVARFEPENHVLEIVKGYVASSAELPLVVVGSAPYSDAYTAAIEAAADSRVRLLGGVWDQELLDQLYANAASYLHGHSVGGTNPSLLRAVGAGTATIAFDSVFNREVLGAAGDYFTGADDLAELLADYRPRTEGLAEVAARYDWDQVALGYEQLCADLAGGLRTKASGRRNRPGWQEGVADSVLVAHPSAELYGSDRVLLESVSGLIEDGREVVVALPGAGPLADELVARGAQVVHCPTPVLRKSALSPLGLVGLAAAAVRSLGPARRLIAGRRLVYVNTLTIPLWLVAGRLAGVPVICHVHEAEQSAAPLVRRGLYAPLLLASRLIVNSRFSSQVIAETWPGLARRTVVVYNGVPGPDAVELPRTDPTPVRLLFLGRLSPRKGPQVAIEAAALLRERGVEVRLALLGAVFEGYEWFADQLHQQADDLGVAVEWLGFQPSIWERVAQSDVVLVPSTVDEPFGNTAVEAMLAQRPLVVSQTSGLREAAAGYRNARFVPADDPAALAEAVVELLAEWSQVRETISADRELAIRRHDPARYRRALAAWCRPNPGENS
jgi:Glycosyltransferase